MPHHKYNCTFVPPQVLENLARAGVDNARLGIQQSKISCRKRAEKYVDVDSARILTRQKKVSVGSTQRVRAAFRDVGLPHIN